MSSSQGGPVAGLLAAWGSAWLSGQVGVDDVFDALGTPGTVVGMGEESLLAALTRWRRAGATMLGVALPVPGDPIWLPGPASFAAAAREAGQAVFALDGSEPRLALVPKLCEHGNEVEGVVTSVTWHAYDVEPAGPPVVQVSEAAQELRTATEQATHALMSLDVARWRSEVAGPLEELRAARGREFSLPPGWPPRAVALLGDAHRLGRVLELAMADAGGAVTSDETRARAATLTQLGRVVHRARLAGWNAHAEPS